MISCGYGTLLSTDSINPTQYYYKLYHLPLHHVSTTPVSKATHFSGMASTYLIENGKITSVKLKKGAKTTPINNNSYDDYEDINESYETSAISNTSPFISTRNQEFDKI